MFSLDPAIAAGLTRSHGRSTSIEVFRANARVLASAKVPIVDGSVTIDGTAATRRRVTVRVADPDGTLVPKVATDPLAPFGNELKTTQTVQIDTGAIAVIPLGVFRISQSQPSSTGVIQMTGYDRSRAIALARLEVATSIALGSNYSDAIQSFINTRMSGLTWSAAGTTHPTPLLVFDAESDPWKIAEDMASSIGQEALFDPTGLAVLRTLPNPATDPVVASYIEGENATILPGVTPTLSDDPGYNGAVVIGEPTGQAPVWSAAWDDNPASATYYLGPYGKRPTFIRSQYVATQTQADEAAAAELRRVLGTPETVTFTAVPNPAHDAGDVIRIKQARAGIDDLYSIDSLTLPFKFDGTMSVTARRRKTA